MTITFEYVTGNPDNLIPGADADMNDIQGPFIDLKDFLNSGILDSIARSAPIIGEVRFVAVLTAPQLWLPCDGAPVSRGTYAKLFNVIGETYGKGDASTTFNVPDLRGRVPVGPGKADGTGTTRTPGAKAGSETININAMPNHNHTGTSGVDSPDHGHSGVTDAQGDHQHSWSRPLTLSIIPFNGTVLYWIQQEAGAVGWDSVDTSVAGLHSHNVNVGGANARHQHSIPSQGGGAADGNLPPSLCVPAYIYADA